MVLTGQPPQFSVAHTGLPPSAPALFHHQPTGIVPSSLSTAAAAAAATQFNPLKVRWLHCTHGRISSLILVTDGSFEARYRLQCTLERYLIVVKVKYRGCSLKVKLHCTL